MKAAPIVLLTDFGLQDAYVGMMKGVIASIAPRTPVIDLTHGVPRGDILRGAFHLWQATDFFPGGTVFVAVVDPGVGTSRRALGAAWPGFTCFVPDNGLLSFLCARSQPRQVVELGSPRFRLPAASATFHGRDIFAPAAAHLASGASLQDMGPAATEIAQLPLPAISIDAEAIIRGRILFADAFGNLITNLGLLHVEGEKLILDPWFPGWPSARLDASATRARLPDGTQLAVSSAFGDVEPGKPVAYVGSSGLLEIALNQGNAADALGLAAGQEISLIRKG